MSKSFHKLKVSEVVKETEDAVSLFFEVPETLKEEFVYMQGQHLTLRFFLKGQEARRAYSMCSSPLEPRIAVTVKRVKGGLVSNYINDFVKAGDEIDVLPPEGRFFTALDPDQRKTYYLFGAGSGITPLFSMIKTIVEQEPQSTVFLLYGNRSEETILFREQLAQLSQRYKGQLLVEHTLSNPRREKAKGLAGLFSKGTLSWEGRTGRIDDKMVNTFLSENPARSREIVYFICGPGNMIEAVEKSLQKQGIDKKVIHTEHFTSNLSADAPRIQGKDGAHVSVTLNNQTIDIHVPAGKTILHALIDNKYDPPYSCTSGACSTCMAKVQEGSVKMDACYALDDDEVAQGYILTCQSHPTSAEVKISYDV